RIRLAVNPTSYQGKQFYWEGLDGFEPGVHRVFKALVSRSTTFLDIGANLGLYSVLARAYNPDARVLSFEPLPAAYAFLQQNLALNGLTDIDTFPLAVSDVTGSATFHAPFNPKFAYLRSHLGGTGSLDEKASTENREAITVPTARLDDILKSGRTGPISLIKLDTEGTEDRVIQGAKETIRSHRPLILCEVLHGRIEAALDQLLDELDYAVFAVGTDGLIPIDSLERDRLEGNDYLFCPAEKTGELGNLM
ncbi:MAG: FkbM family methyltransferase, partial [Bacteroidetes bacterium]|nr:FkbM family methyltransferase [Bacteroidota bacterium]